ncbi:NUDIX hydrolase [Oceanobacillus manasiensis]|uniref:NUDIX hydrolase n=1 Tax=Oceanobacillus manasiensis TaxID=586413 RepID=UPI0005A7C941|nr:NUDIX hydrolase [Oceanobacillus manasiensis]
MERVNVVYVLLYDHSEERILMVKNKGMDSSYYTLPGGAVEIGETLEDAAIREVIEETGLSVELDGVLAVSEAFLEQRGHHAIFFTFRGKVVGGKINIMYPEEIEEVTWMNAEEALKYASLSTEGNELVNRNSTIPYVLRGKVIHKN